MTRHRLVQVTEKSSEPASPQPALAFQEHNWIDFYKKKFLSELKL